MLKVEFHTHSADDPIDDIPYSTKALIDRAAELGYDALAITLHDAWLDPSLYTSYAKSRGIVLIPGIERTIDGRHVLLLNFSRASERVSTFADIVRLKQDEGGLVIAPHPYFPAPSALRGELERHRVVFDAVEYNAMFTSLLNFNRAAVRWAARHGLPMVGCGDIHQLAQLGTTYSLVDAEPTADAICDAVRRGRVQVRATPLSIAAAASIMTNLMVVPRLAKLGVKSVAGRPFVGVGRDRARQGS
jgi:predicted metal-dependent phosphoesterase TrpH